jgi:hypothetical protein
MPRLKFTRRAPTAIARGSVTLSKASAEKVVNEPKKPTVIP